MKESKTRVIVVAGPTASGKSDLAIALARQFNGEIISADSRQVYRGMDIGTGKVTKKEQRIARHWLLDVASPGRQYSVAQWKKAAQKAIRDIVRRGKTPIICGGTGFWIDALVHDAVLPDVKPDMALRAEFEKESAVALYTRLLDRDPVRATVIDRHNKRRLIRALEIIEKTKQPVPVSQFASPYQVLYLVLSPDKEELDVRIAKRLDVRLKHGMVAEVKQLHEGGVSWKRLENFGLEYRWLARFLKKKITRTEMRDNLLRDIVHYSKRQLTWFRSPRQSLQRSAGRNPDAIWLTGASRAEAFQQVAGWLSRETRP